MKKTQENILSYLKELKPELEPRGIEKVALFGSFATQTQNVYSDIDVAIQKKKSYRQEHTAYEYLELISQIRHKIMKALQLPCDVYDLDSKSVFKKHIEKDLIYV